MTRTNFWPELHMQALERLALSTLSFAQISIALNDELGTSYSRNACLGKARRMNIPHPSGFVPSGLTKRGKEVRRNNIKRERRWAIKPSLAERAERLAAKKKIREMFAATNTPRTSVAYRKHMPRLQDMSKGEMRAMLTVAVRNTAALEVA